MYIMYEPVSSKDERGDIGREVCDGVVQGLPGVGFPFLTPQIKSSSRFHG